VPRLEIQRLVQCFCGHLPRERIAINLRVKNAKVEVWIAHNRKFDLNKTVWSEEMPEKTSEPMISTEAGTTIDVMGSRTNRRESMRAKVNEDSN
jgi:hypothetical protein